VFSRKAFAGFSWKIQDCKWALFLKTLDLNWCFNTNHDTLNCYISCNNQCVVWTFWIFLLRHLLEFFLFEISLENRGLYGKIYGHRFNWRTLDSMNWFNLNKMTYIFVIMENIPKTATQSKFLWKFSQKSSIGYLDFYSNIFKIFCENLI
jgi:hypothetical protein